MVLLYIFHGIGKLLWFSGPPGAGKSTTAQLMGRYHKYVYYEADCFGSFMNPFVDLQADDPTMMQMAQAPLYVSYKLQGFFGVPKNLI